MMLSGEDSWIGEIEAKRSSSDPEYTETDTYMCVSVKKKV